MFSRFNTRACLAMRSSPVSVKENNVLQLVRGRKDYRLPKAPSKIYIVRQPTPRDPAETEFLAREYARYRTTMRAIHKLFKEEVEAVDYTGVNLDQKVQDDEKEHERLMEVNRRWNEDIAQMRAEREIVRQQEREDKYLLELEQFEAERQQLRQEADERVKLIQEKAKSYISPENLEEEIEKALDIVKDYNFAIDLEGNMIQKVEADNSPEEKSESSSS